MLFTEIAQIEAFKERRFGLSHSYWAHTVRADGQEFRLSAGHRLSFLRTEDRTPSYIPFIQEFERRAVAAKPALNFILDEYREAFVDRMYGRVAVCAIRFFGRLPRKVSASICGAIGRNVGFIFKGNRYARQQLSAALSTLTSREIRLLLRGMWDNFGRTFGEYGHTSELMQFSTETPLAGEVIMDERTADTLRHIARERRAAIMIGAHLCNWEIAGMVAGAAGREIAVVYKRQASAAVTAELKRQRAKFAARLIETGPMAPREIVRALRDGMLVGMLVDQRYTRGIEVRFFGQMCRVNPLPAQLADTGNWPIYVGRVTRLPDQRYQIEVVGPLELPRQSTGKIDIDATMQTIFGMIETWIRQEPKQWMWVHRLIR
jgi:KDO2-lipid IV(A) lauroyltransferase